MPEPYLGEIKIGGFDFPPKGYALCNGQLLPIAQNQALFALLGTTYGGDGQTSFALPDLRGRTPIHVGSGHTLGERGGEEAHTVSMSEMPQHTHVLNATSDLATSTDPENKVLARGGSNFYGQFGTPTPMGVGSVRNTGGSQPHNNMAPFLTLNFFIALQGIFPSRN
jgi:microcystin-dependent protein